MCPPAVDEQVGSVGAVLAEANGRLVRVAGALPPGPPVREIDHALAAVRHSAAAGFDAIAGRLGDAIHPPSPCHLTGGTGPPAPGRGPGTVSR